MPDSSGVDYYVSRTPEWLAHYDDEATHLRPVLAQACGQDEAEAILLEARQRLVDLIPTLPYIGGDENPLTGELVRSAHCLALYETMRAHGKTAAETGKALYDATAGLVAAGGPPRQQLSAEELSRRRRERAERSQRRQYPDDWVYAFVPGDGDAFDYGYDFAECAAQKLYHAHGADEFLPYYCFLDYAASRAAGTGLHRTKTLAEGHPLCNHRFKRGRETGQDWPPPWLRGAETREQRRLYGDLAWTWPIISRPENYVQEAEQFCSVIHRYARIEVHSLLDLGCGGGHNDWTLKKHFTVTGVDISEPMLDLARRLNPEAAYCPGDMRRVRLGRLFDAVIIADSIDYMLTPAELRAAFVTAYQHLRPGGVFCTYAEVTCERPRHNEVECSTGRCGDVEITFVEQRYDPDPTDTTYESVFVYLIRRSGRLEIETDVHLGGIFRVALWLQLLRQVGFEVHELETVDDRFPLFACVKPGAR